MQSRFITLVLAAAFVILTAAGQAFAQAPDTLDVPNVVDGNPLGAINKTIVGDTTAAGERNNINRVYRLGRGLIYFLDSRMDIRFPLTMIADDDDPGNPTAPPIIAPGILQDGSSPGGYIRILEGDATIKNVLFMGVRPDQQPIGWNTVINLRADSTRLVIDGCVFSNVSNAAIAGPAKFSKIYISNSTFRNMVHPTSWFGGQGIRLNAVPLDTVIMVNNTFFNSGSYLYCPNRDLNTYTRIEHNTVFTNHVNIFYAPYERNTMYKNNILFGITAMGQRDTEIDGGWFDWDGEISAIASLDTLPTDLAAAAGITEADRVVRFDNNAYFWPQAMVDFFNSTDTLTAPLWINSRTQGMLDDDATWPGIAVEGNLNADPGFNAEMMAQVDSVVKYCTKLRTGTQTDYRHYYEPDGDPFGVQWPLPEDLTYSNTALHTASTDGLPLGDLNWYPDQKKIWEDLQTSVEPKEEDGVPEGFELAQNFPNPFNPATTIKYSLTKNSQVKLTVYNMVGQKVKTLVDTKRLAGNYSATWNGLDESGMSVASGVYYYRLETDSFKATKKMLLMK